MSSSLRVLFWVCLLATLATAAAHVGTFFDRAWFPILVLLPLALIIWPLVLWHWRRVPRRNLVSEVFGDIPLWMKVAAAALVLHAFANHFVGHTLNEGARPVVLVDGRVVLQRAGEIVRVLDREGFAHAHAVAVRMMTGHFLAVFGLAALALEACWIKNGPAMAGRSVDGA